MNECGPYKKRRREGAYLLQKSEQADNNGQLLISDSQAISRKTFQLSENDNREGLAAFGFSMETDHSYFMTATRGNTFSQQTL